jgi:hypothetical protein
MCHPERSRRFDAITDNASTEFILNKVNVLSITLIIENLLFFLTVVYGTQNTR